MTTFKMSRTAWAAAAAAALAVSTASPVMAESRTDVSPEPAALAVSVTSTRGAYRIEGSFGVETEPTVAWAVLTDYDRVPSFVSSMRSSTAQREDGRLLVTQEAVGRIGPFTRTMHVVLDVTEQELEVIAFRDVGGGSFRSYAGSWRIEPDGVGLRITYTLDLRPRTSPPLFAKSIIASNARGLLEQVRTEIRRRSRIASSN
jgi:carbon monoxide dehydrogenase subunit G